MSPMEHPISCRWHMRERTIGTQASPLHFTPGQSAEAVATRLVGVFRHIDALPDKVQWAQAETTRCIADGGLPALRRAGHAIAAAIDAEAAFFDRHAYHNRQHFCEVMLATCLLSQVNRLTAYEAQLLSVAALIHDLGHGDLPTQRFGAERLSMERAIPALDAAGVDSSDIARLTALILATEPVDGVRVALTARQFHRQGLHAPVIPERACELGQLANDEVLARLAVLLCEADLLPSIALTFEHGMNLQGRLSEEWGRPLTAADKSKFVDQVLASGLIGEFFAPNVAAFRRELATLVDEHPQR
ncbi:hypothetical protein BH11PSE8_BH11PSE8_20650 [soil metagenome]